MPLNCIYLKACGFLQKGPLCIIKNLLNIVLQTEQEIPDLSNDQQL